jgi:hypothetical protein
MTLDTLERSRRSTPPGSGNGARPPTRGFHAGWGRVVLFAALIAFLAVAATLAVVAVVDDDETASPTTTSAPTSLTTSPTTPTSTPPTSPPSNNTSVPPTTVVVDTSTAVWPYAGSGVRYSDPVAAARGFAEQFVGFTDPVVGEFQAGDARSGEVEVQARSDGPVTTVFVRQLSSSDDWWVLGAAAANIQLDEPEALSLVSSPVRLQGTSTAFEANVSVDVRQDGVAAPIGHGFVMGGSMGDMAPFDGTVAFEQPTSEFGVIVLYTRSMENGAVWEAAVVRVGFAR